MKKHGKIYVEALNAVDKSKFYTVEEAAKLVKSISKRKFDETIEISINLNVDITKSDEQVRNSFVLPKGTGKTKKILVITKNATEEAKTAGADFVGGDDMIEKISKENWFDFDIIIATPDMMASLGKIGKILGPKGLMPNPKTGTVTTNVKATIENIKKGMIEYKADTYGIVHSIIGKVSFKAADIAENMTAFITDVIKNKPSGVKGTFIKSITVSSTMGPGIKIDKNTFDI